MSFTMKGTKNKDDVTSRYSKEAYLQVLCGRTVGKDELLFKACDYVWDLEIEQDKPNSLDVALLLSELGSDETTLIVALLSASSTAGTGPGQELEKLFGTSIVSLVRNVQLLHDFHSHDVDNTPDQVERLRRMLLSMVEDVRVVLIKLAYRVQRLRKLSHTPSKLREDISRETLDIFAPIANRLGIGQLKWELEDLSFRYLEPETYKRVASYLDEKREEREAFIENVEATLKRVVADAGIQAEIYGRPKHIYSIWKKMIAKQRGFHELFDVRAVRIVVNSVAECYVVLGLVHGLWRHIEKEFDDYIANPKPNGYQSLHTAVHGPENKPVEVQIRSIEMDEFAEHGIAAHWRYKEGNKADSNLQSSIDSLRRLLDPGQEREEELLENFQSEMFHDRVFVLTPEGRVLDLPQGSTPVDFAYAVHTEVGHRCRGAKVNGRIVQLTYALNNGERVEILTSKEASPARDWLIPHLGYTHTSRAKNRIRSWYRKQDRDSNLVEGKSIYEHEIKRHGVRPDIDAMLKHYRQNNADDFYVAIGCGDISMSQLSAALQDVRKKEHQEDIPVKPRARTHKKTGSTSNVYVQGVGNLLNTMANCCRPLPGDDIIGFITKGKGVSIHRQDCTNIINLTAEDRLRLIEVEWGGEDVETYPVSLIVLAMDRHGLLNDVSKTLADEKVNVIAMNTLSDKKDQTARMSVTLEITDVLQLTRIMDKLRQLPNVTEVLRGSNVSH